MVLYRRKCDYVAMTASTWMVKLVSASLCMILHSVINIYDRQLSEYGVFKKNKIPCFLDDLEIYFQKIH